MGAHLIVSLIVLTSVPPPKELATPMPAEQAAASAKTKDNPMACDDRPFQYLVGRTISDLLTTRLPPNTRIYRVDDPQTQPVTKGRLSVELSRNTRVRRVYCS